MSDYNYGSSALDFSSSPGLGGAGGSGGRAGQPNSAQMMEAVKQQIAVANAQELLSVSSEIFEFFPKIYYFEIITFQLISSLVH